MLTRAATWKDRLEYGVVRAIEGGFALLPLDLASWLGGAIGRMIGPLLPPTRRIRRNLDLVMPELSPADRDRIVSGVWENLGRIVAEYGHLTRIVGDEAERRIELVGHENLLQFSRAGKPSLLVSAHFGNWEVGALAARMRGVRLAQVYRAIDNPLINDFVVRLRESLGVLAVPKGAKGGRALVGAIKDGYALGLLVDQKMNDGIEVPFFDRPAMTAPAAAEFAVRYGCPFLPCIVERTRGAHFRMIVLPPLEPLGTGDRRADVYDLTLRMNRQIEAWIRAKPEQWFWLHRRWPDSKRH